MNFSYPKARDGFCSSYSYGVELHGEEFIIVHFFSTNNFINWLWDKYFNIFCSSYIYLLLKLVIYITIQIKIN